jgi:FkbM family methyltransferase
MRVGLTARLSNRAIRFRIRAFKARFRDQKLEFDTIMRHLTSRDVACDIGANKGSFTYWLSRWCRHGRVFAFEPQLTLADQLSDVCRAMHLHNVKVEALAAYSHSGQKELFVPKAHQPGASLSRISVEGTDHDAVLVPVVSLDEYFFDQGHLGKDQRVRLLKIDAEGAELEMLRGAEKIIWRYAPLLVFECENRHLENGSVLDVFSYLEGRGYSGSFILRDRLLPISQFDAAIHQRQDGKWFWKDPGYCNNFIFRKASERLIRDGG